MGCRLSLVGWAGPHRALSVRRHQPTPATFGIMADNPTGERRPTDALRGGGLVVEPLNPVIGAEADGAQLADLSQSDDGSALLRTLLAEHQVLVFRDQVLDAEAHKAVGRVFGELAVHPTKRLLGVDGDPEIFTVKAGPKSVLNNGGLWHTDLSAEENPPMASVLRILELPSSGGDTLFASMRHAFSALSEPLATMLMGLEALHDGRIDLRRYGVALGPDQHYPSAVHPVVAAHPRTGAATLFVNPGFTSHIVGLSDRESGALLDLLYSHVAASPQFQCRVRWEPGTVVIWDNRAVQHFAVWDYYPERRLAERVTVAGSGPPVGAGTASKASGPE